MSLTSLPTELLELIVSYVDLLTLHSLRLTARHYHSRTFLVFKHRFFNTQHLSWTRESLQRLVDIAAHPELGDALQHLIIDATPYYALELWKMRRRSSDAGHLTPITDDEDGSKLVQKLHNEHETLQQEAETTARWFNETRFDVSCLKRAFAQMKSLTSLTFAYESTDMRYSKFAQRYCEASQHEMSRPFVSTLSALAASGARVEHIYLPKDRSHGAISVGRLESLAPSLRYFDAMFEKLNTLQLILRDWRSPDTGFELERTRAPFSVRFLAMCGNVRTLELSFYSTLESDLFSELARECAFERLESISLGLFRIKRSRDLFGFLEPSRRYLKELRLRHVLLDENDEKERGWKKILGEFADEEGGLQSLRVFHAERLFSGTPLGVLRVSFRSGGSVSSVLHVEGEHWRDELREHAGGYIESAAGRMWESGATAYPFVRSDSM
jgi:hypothetical protein